MENLPIMSRRSRKPVNNLTEFSPIQPKNIIKSKTIGQSEYIKKIINNDVIFCTGPAGSGKAQPYYSQVQTPQGPKNMGDIIIGDSVCTPDGNIAKVLYKFPQGKKDVYKVTFSNGSHVVCCKEHLWEVYKDSKQSHPYIVQLQDIFNSFRSKSKRLYSLKLTQPVYMVENQHFIHPYIMGVLLGDGSITSCCRFTSNDEEVVNSVTNYLDKNYRISNTSKLQYNIIQNKKNGKNKYTEELIRLNLLDHLSINKYIPKEYLYDSVKNRIDLLKGLFDTDGTIGNSGTIEYSTSSHQLMLDVKYLVESLGGIVSVSSRLPKYRYKNELKIGNTSYRVYCRFPNNFTMFNLGRKVKRIVARTKYCPKLLIDNIEKIGNEECFCIYIDHPKHLYLTDNFVVTHNSAIAVGMAAIYLCKGDYDKIVLTRPIVSAGTRKLGALPGEIKEKIAPYLVPVVEELKHFLGDDLYWRFIKDDRIIAEPLELMRGRNFHNSFMILDEAQNCEYEDLIMFVTRMGEGTKVCINGDTDQCDLIYQDTNYSALEDVVKRVQGLDRFGTVELNENDIVRNPLIKQFLKATARRKSR